MSAGKKLIVFDTTLRDGEQAAHPAWCQREAGTGDAAGPAWS